MAVVHRLSDLEALFLGNKPRARPAERPTGSRDAHLPRGKAWQPCPVPPRSRASLSRRANICS